MRIYRVLVRAFNGVQRHQNKWMALLLLSLVLVGIRLWPHIPLSQHASSSVAVYDAHGKLLRLTLTSDDKYRVWVPLAQMPQALIEGVLLHEDQWFHYHIGFNPLSLARGGWITYVRGGNRQGGSTITMQLARLMYRLNTRTSSGKLRQVLRAIELELCYSKNDILEAYLNYAPYGHNIEGAGAASVVYFDKSVSTVTLPEALALAVIPQDPTRRLRNDSFVTNGSASVLDTINIRLSESRARLYQRWIHRHPEDATQQTLMRLPLKLRSPQKLPFEAPHFVEQILAEQHLAGRTDSRIATTLDLSVQKTLEQQLKQYIQRQQSRGIRNASALLLDTRDMGVKALVGSVDYFDAVISGQVNGTVAKRSPGSTLKPLLYALAMDQGILHPMTVLRDVPTSFGPFTPENFDGRFLGPVTATDALIRSRNIPAVAISARLAHPNFYEFLRDAGISRLASEQYYGLGLVLGGGEVSMQELARLYATLANHGEMRALRLRVDAPQAAGVRLLSAEASFMTLDMLRQNPRPDDLLAHESARLPVYWKTGTSWGFHDAWTAGIFGPYVLIVWIGNFDNQANPAFIGIEAAAPLFFRIIDSIRAQNTLLAEPVRTTPRNLKKVEVCLASGDLPNAWCPQRGMTWFIPGRSPIRVSTIHRPIVMDARNGNPVCPPYGDTPIRTDVYEYWPSDMMRVFAQAGIPRRVPPAAADCANGIVEDGQIPQINSPLRGSVYTLRAQHVEEARVALMATVDASAQTLYWFVDDGFVGSVKPSETLFWQPSNTGNFSVRAVDDHGRVDQREIRVTRVE